MKKAVSFIICLTLILSMTSVFASDFEAENIDSTADEVTYCYGTCGENLAWEYASNGTLTISGVGETDDYRFSFSPPWNGYNVKKLIVCDGVTRLGTYAFSNFSNLTEVSLPDSVNEIGEGAFLNCKSLNRVNIESVGGWCGIAFKNYTSNPLVYAKKLYIGDSLITSAVIPNGVESINDYAFYNCVDLESIALSDSVTEIGANSFYGCENLTDFNFGNGLKKIGNNAFYGCSALANVKFPESLESIGFNAFIDCRSITEITIPKSVAELDSAVFSGCTSLKAVYFPDTLTKIGAFAFEDCSALESVVIPNGVNEIVNSTFYNCASLESVVIPDSVTNLGWYAFYECTGLKDVYYTGSQEEWSKIDFGAYNESLSNAAVHFNYTPAYPTPDYKFGDVNLDGAVNVKDATYIQRIVVEEAGLTVTDEQRKLADIDGDGVISVKDATALQILIVNS